ncbi:MAG: ATP-binding cassette domain-containing protein [Ectothiorhodospiraceae bacterium]
MLTTLRDLSVTLGERQLLDSASFTVRPGQRIAVIGRNGCGKSTLLRILAGKEHPDGGSIERRQGLRIGYLPQEVPEGLAGRVFDVVAGGLGDAGMLVRRHHDAARAVAAGEDGAMKRLDAIQRELEAADAWQLTYRIESVLSQLELPTDADFEGLSGGVKRRVMLARALAGEPELLLLDEPTNHLDIDAIAWLEGFLKGLAAAQVLITHDRRFLDAVATDIAEIDRGKLSLWPGDYSTYERRKAEALAAEEKAREAQDRKLAAEETWIRQGIKARRTRNQGRVRALQALRRDRAARRNRDGSASIAIDEGRQSGKLVIEAEGLEHRLGGRPIVRQLDMTVLRGDRIGLVGPNGVGKTTLLNLLLGRMEPDRGSVRHGTHLQVAYFDQLRSGLREDASVMENVAGQRDSVDVGGRQRHVISYLEDFLFSPERARTPVSALSGGEKNRVMLARLFTRPANVLVLDEPTNDLDVETLEVLESRLAAFEGTVLLVSHDRAFLDNCVTSVLAFEGGGVVREYVGGYDDWLRQRSTGAEEAGPRAAAATADTPRPRRTPRKLGYREQQELESLPGRLERLEAEQADLQQRLSDPALYAGDDGDRVAELTAALEKVDAALEAAFDRWEELEARQRELETPQP